MVESLSSKEVVEYPNGGKSYFYVIGQTVIIIDEGICKCDSEEEKFSYTLITDKQNYYMHRYEKHFTNVFKCHGRKLLFLKNSVNTRGVGF